MPAASLLVSRGRTVNAFVLGVRGAPIDSHLRRQTFISLKGIRGLQCGARRLRCSLLGRDSSLCVVSLGGTEGVWPGLTSKYPFGCLLRAFTAEVPLPSMRACVLDGARRGRTAPSPFEPSAKRCPAFAHCVDAVCTPLEPRKHAASCLAQMS